MILKDGLVSSLFCSEGSYDPLDPEPLNDPWKRSPDLSRDEDQPESDNTRDIQTSVYAGHDGVILWSNWLITGGRSDAAAAIGGRIRTGTIFRTGSEPSPTWWWSSCCCNWCLSHVCFDLSSSDVTHLALRNHCFPSAPCWWKCLSSFLQIKNIKKKSKFTISLLTWLEFFRLVWTDQLPGSWNQPHSFFFILFYKIQK